MYRKTILSIAVLVVIISMGFISVTRIKPASAQFIISDWDYPDEYDQGINVLEFLENSTGSWVQVGTGHYPNSTHTIQWNTSFIRINVWTVLNSTITGALDFADGQNYQRHYINMSLGGAVLFSQQGFTNFMNTTWSGNLWWYGYYIVIEYALATSAIYEIIITWDVSY